MENKRTKRLNSLLKEVISEVIRDDVRNPKIAKFISVTEVDITPDLHFAKVMISVLGSEIEKKETIKALNSATGYIGMLSSKKMTIRYFPQLSFFLDTSVEKHIHIEKILSKIEKERYSRPNDDEQ